MQKDTPFKKKIMIIMMKFIRDIFFNKSRKKEKELTKLEIQSKVTCEHALRKNIYKQIV